MNRAVRDSILRIGALYGVKRRFCGLEPVSLYRLRVLAAMARDSRR